MNETFAFFGMIALAVHLYESDSAGIVKLLIRAPTGCNTSKREVVLLFIGPRKSDRISSNTIILRHV